ncbi:MAG: response regulator [Pirellulaceae bacterium]
MSLTPTLLITDDDRDFRESLVAVFDDRGFDTVMASDGVEACDVVREQQIHLVLLDYQMPRMTGLEALRLIKQYDQRLPVILMSSALDEALSQAARAANAFAVHSKPVNVAKIRQDVSSALHSIYNWSADN